MKKNPAGLIVLMILLYAESASFSAMAQPEAEVAGERKNITLLYSHEVISPVAIINGKEYEPYYQRAKMKPLLCPGQERSATLFTTTRQYDNVTLQYDTYIDEVVYTDTSAMINLRFPQVALNRDIVTGFNLYFEDDTSLFRNLGTEEAGKGLEEGYYEIAYEGNCSYFIKHYSKYYEKEGIVNYKYNPRHYINTSGQFIQIKNRKNLLRLFGNEAPAVREFIHNSGIRVKEAGKEQFISILKYYDSLKKSMTR